MYALKLDYAISGGCVWYHIMAFMFGTYDFRGSLGGGIQCTQATHDVPILVSFRQDSAVICEEDELIFIRSCQDYLGFGKLTIILRILRGLLCFGIRRVRVPQR